MTTCPVSCRIGAGFNSRPDTLHLPPPSACLPLQRTAPPAAALFCTSIACFSPPGSAHASCDSIFFQVTAKNPKIPYSTVQKWSPLRYGKYSEKPIFFRIGFFVRLPYTDCHFVTVPRRITLPIFYRPSKNRPAGEIGPQEKSTCKASRQRSLQAISSRRSVADDQQETISGRRP